MRQLLDVLIYLGGILSGFIICIIIFFKVAYQRFELLFNEQEEHDDINSNLHNKVNNIIEFQEIHESEELTDDRE